MYAANFRWSKVNSSSEFERSPLIHSKFPTSMLGIISRQIDLLYQRELHRRLRPVDTELLIEEPLVHKPVAPSGRPNVEVAARTR
ncbi:MAG: hypothetical protein LAO30_18655 [Acidobacteriia bacterium]|nr:hypothetical protein [Terriglobia bacterium]